MFDLSAHLETYDDDRQPHIAHKHSHCLFAPCCTWHRAKDDRGGAKSLSVDDVAWIDDIILPLQHHNIKKKYGLYLRNKQTL